MRSTLRRTLLALAAPAGALAAQGTDAATIAAGRRVFETTCTTCHTVQPPVKNAPPMSHIARHYRQAVPARDSALARLEAWLVEPDPARSLLPAHARERFGLMPMIPLEPAERRAVAAYVWSLADSARMGGMGGPSASPGARGDSAGAHRGHGGRPPR